MKPLLNSIILAFVVFQLAALPTQSAQAVSEPHIQFQAMTFDFGKVLPTDHPQHDFIFTNIGNATLEIKEVKPGCGCTTAGAWDKEVAPGKTGKIPLQFNPVNFSGPVFKTAMVTCNDPAMATYNLAFQATVWRPIDMQPQYAYFLPVEGEETNETKVVRITSNLDEPITLEPPTAPTGNFQTELKTVRPGKEFELRVTYPNRGSNGVVHDTITIRTSLTNTPPLTLTAMVMPQPAVIAVPQPIQLPSGPFAPDYSYPVTVRNNSHTPIRLSDPSVNAEGVKITIKEIEAGKNFRLDLAFPSDFKVPQGQIYELSVKTSHPKYRTVKLPITQSPLVVSPTPVARIKPTGAVPLK